MSNEENMSLKDIAAEVASSNPQTVPTQAENTQPQVVNVDGAPIVVGPPKKKVEAPQIPEGADPVSQMMMNTPTPSMAGLSADTLQSNFNPQDLIKDEKKEIEQAKAAAEEEAQEILQESIPQKPVEEKPAEIVINKEQNVDDLGLTEEEHKKLERAKRIKLVLVEDKELANIVIERPPEEHKADYIRFVEGSISNYSVPLPMFGDFVTFKGAQILQILNAVNFEDARLHEVLSTQAQLIYDKLIGGSLIRKYDENGKTVMTYNEFVNKFPYPDVDLAIYAIACASSGEETTASLRCNMCKHEWEHKFNIKKLLNTDSMAETYKDRTEMILAHKGDADKLKLIHDANNKVYRYKSPFTNNIYDLSYPTIARAIDVLKRIDEENQAEIYMSIVLLFLSRILIYNNNSDKYIEVSANEPDLLAQTARNLANEDTIMLANQIQKDMTYQVQFKLPGACPSCGNAIDMNVSIQNLIFLMARDSMAEIAQ